MKGNILKLLLWLAPVLFVISCSGLKSGGKLEAYYFINQVGTPVKFQEQINETLGQLPAADMNMLMSGLHAAYQSARMADRMQLYARQLNWELLSRYEIYQDFMEGDFVFVQMGLLCLSNGQKEAAKKYFSKFLKKHPQKDMLHQFVKDFLYLLKTPSTTLSFIEKYSGHSETSNLTPAAIGSAFPSFEFNSSLFKYARGDYPRFLYHLSNNRLDKAWQIFLSTGNLTKPIYREKVVLTKTKGEVNKEYYDPGFYTHIREMHIKTLRELTKAYFNARPSQFAAGLDSLTREKFFYLNLHLAKMDALGLTEEANQFLPLLDQLSETPFQKMLVEVLREKKQPGPMKPPVLPKGYHPFMEALLQAFFLEQASAKGETIKKADIDRCRARLYDTAPDDVLRDLCMRYIGLAYLNSKLYKEAATHLNYSVQKGFDIEANDPVNLLDLAYAYYMMRTQMGLSNWIFSQAQKYFPYLIPAYNNTQFYLQALLGK